MPGDELIPTAQPGAEHGGWAQVNVEFADWQHAEQATADHLRPLLTPEAGISSWWFVRKHPCWRLRYRPIDATAQTRFTAGLHHLAAATTTVRGWHPSGYEPETIAFGGPAAMELAHDLFHHDSRTVLADLHHPDQPLPGRRELSVLAVSVLLRAAGLDWFEQGDVWAKVADLRHPGHPGPRVAPDAPKAQGRLMTIDAGPHSPLTAHGALSPLAGWISAFDNTGRRLARLAHNGELQRGLRAVLAHHVIFHWNRLGLHHAEQLALATLARDVVLTPAHGAAS